MTYFIKQIVYEHTALVIVIVICLPTKHSAVLKNSLKGVCVFQIKLEFGNVKDRGKPEYLEKNPSEQMRAPTTNSTHIWLQHQGFEPGPHWWEVSALTTAPPLLPLSIGRFHAFEIFFPFLGNVLNACMGNLFWISKAFTNDQGLGIFPSFDEHYPWLLLKETRGKQNQKNFQYQP